MCLSTSYETKQLCPFSCPRLFLHPFVFYASYYLLESEDPVQVWNDFDKSIIDIRASEYNRKFWRSSSGPKESVPQIVGWRLSFLESGNQPWILLRLG